MTYDKSLYYQEVGSGPPVVLIHCPAVTHRFWDPVVAQLGSACRCVSPDLPGHGRSPDDPRGWTLADAAGAIAELCRRVAPQRPVLVGYSTASLIALKTAIDYPDLPAGIVTVGGFSEGATMGIQVAGWGGFAMNQMGLTGLIARLVVLKNHHDREHALRMLKEAPTITRAAMRSYLKATVSARLTDRLAEIKAPALLICGERDSKARSLQQKLQGGLRESELVLIPNGDHHIPTTMPGQLASMIKDFAHRVAARDVSVHHPQESIPIAPPMTEGFGDRPYV